MRAFVRAADFCGGIMRASETREGLRDGIPIGGEETVWIGEARVVILASEMRKRRAAGAVFFARADNF